MPLKLIKSFVLLQKHQGRSEGGYWGGWLTPPTFVELTYSENRVGHSENYGNNALVIGFPEGSTPGLTTGCCGRIHVDCNKILPQSWENHNTLFYHLKRGWGNCFFEFYPREYDGKFFKGNIFQICRKLRNCNAWGG